MSQICRSFAGSARIYALRANHRDVVVAAVSLRQELIARTSERAAGISSELNDRLAR